MVESSLSKFIEQKRPDFLDLPKSDVNYGYSSRDGVISDRLVSRPRVAFNVASASVSACVEVKRPVVKGDGLWSRYQLNARILGSKNLRIYMLFDERDDMFKRLFRNAGRGEVTVPNGPYACASFRWLNVCDNVEGHRDKVAECGECGDRYVVGVEVVSCDRLLCPSCFLAHAVRAARSASVRLEAVSERFGPVEHGTISPDTSLVVEYMRRFGKKWEDELWRYCWEQLKGAGVLGAAMVRHARRPDRERQDLYASLHYHFLGFLRGGFDICRNCASRDKRKGISPECRGCKGFMGRVVRANDAGNHCIIKVFEKRKTVMGTLCYIMSHCSQRVDVERDHVLRYFGEVANCKFKSPPVKNRVRCSVCGGEVRHDLKYVGHRTIVRNAWEPSFKSFVLLEPVDSITGLANFVDEARFVDEGGG
jgi:hypothetical protein